VVTLTWGAGAVLLGRWLLVGKPLIPWWHWLVLGLLIITGGGLIALQRWAAGRFYILFAPERGLREPEGRPLDPEDKVLLHATGRFEVEGKSHFWADLLAYWRTFATREHTVMAIVHNTRFALLGHMSEADVGMWYIFFRPEHIETIIPGRLTFGKAIRPALRVVYRNVPTASGSRKRSKDPIVDTVYLAFDGDTERSRVWGDLLADCK
jgi:hypothetical protein